MSHSDRTAQRFFHTIIVLGAALAGSACGDDAGEEEADNGSGGEAQGAAGAPNEPEPQAGTGGTVSPWW